MGCTGDGGAGADADVMLIMLAPVGWPLARLIKNLFCPAILLGAASS